jgi:hypothetical protein
MELFQGYLEVMDEGMGETGEFRFCCCMSMSRG